MGSLGLAQYTRFRKQALSVLAKLNGRACTWSHVTNSTLMFRQQAAATTSAAFDQSCMPGMNGKTECALFKSYVQFKFIAQIRGQRVWLASSLVFNEQRVCCFLHLLEGIWTNKLCCHTNKDYPNACQKINKKSTLKVELLHGICSHNENTGSARVRQR